MKIKAVIFDLDLIELLNGKDNQFDWFLRHGEVKNGKIVPIKTILLDNVLTQRALCLTKNIKPDFIGESRAIDAYLKKEKWGADEVLFVSDKEESVELYNGPHRTVLLKPLAASKDEQLKFNYCRANFKTHTFDDLTKIIYQIEWQKDK